MRRNLSLFCMVAASVVAVLASPAAPLAQTPAEFYRGKTITIVVGLSAGGSYDHYARLLAEYYGRHVPGAPSVVVQNRTGAGSRNAANYVYGAAAKDGTVLAVTVNLLPLSQALDPGAVRYDLGKAHWIGNMANLVSVLALWHTAPPRSIADAQKTEIIVGATGKGTETYLAPAVLNALIGTKFKIVTGYPGINEILLAMERGEVQGRAGSWANLVQQRPDWVRENKIVPLVIIGRARIPELQNLPLITELARDEGDRRILELVSAVSDFSRAFWVAHEVPPDRVAALRQAFDATMKDSEFLRLAQERNTDIIPTPGAEVQAVVLRMLDIPPEIAARARTLLELGSGG